MATEKVVDSGTPPYLPFARFETFVESLKEKALPPRFDRTLVQRMSGAEQSQLGIALKFFRLVEGEDRRFTPLMRRVVSSHGDPAGWLDALTELLGAYDPIVGDLEDAATMGQLTDAFRERGGLSGSALAKAIRFYLSLARTAGAPLSPHFTAPAVPASSPANGDRPRRNPINRSRRSRDSETGDAGGRTPPLLGSKQLRYSVPSGDIQVWLPESITQRELDALAKYLSEYVALMSVPE